MELTIEQQKFQAEVRAFCQQEIEPLAAQIDKQGELPPELMTKISDFGLWGCVAPKKYSGMGLDTVGYSIAVEEVSRVCGSTGIVVAAHNSLGVMPFLLFGSPEQQEKYIPPLAIGKEGLGAFGLTESGAGSDAGGTKTNAIKDGDDWIINGSKCFITNVNLAMTYLITAKTEKIPGSRGISSFIVERGTDGFTLAKKEDKMGLRGSDTREFVFENMRLSSTQMLGKEGDGFKQAMITLDGGRISIGAMALGLAQGALDYALKHAQQRQQFGKTLVNFQAIQMKLADMYTKIQCARQLIYDAAQLEDAHKKFTTEAAMAKLYASEIATEVARDAIQIVGAKAYTDETPLERIYRDVRLCEIGEGTSEILRFVIARDLMKRTA
jgi:alkylation response protein AidB-like acyl-CoA dehydrogenase